MNTECMNKIMLRCIYLARKNVNTDQYPIAAIVTDSEGIIISETISNLRKEFDPTMHPEMAAIRSSSKKIQSRFLTDCYLFTTLEPCPMCTSAAIWARMKGIVFGAFQEDALNYAKTHPSAKLSWRQIEIKSRQIIEKSTCDIELYEGILRDECIRLFN